MSQVAMLTYVTGRVKQGFTSSYPSVPVAYPNQNFVQPDNGVFVAVHIKEGNSYQANLGDKVIDRSTGIVQIDVYVPIESGSKTGLEIAEYSRNLFRRQQVQLADQSSLYFRIGSVGYVGEQNGRVAISMKIEYWRDEPPN